MRDVSRRTITGLAIAAPGIIAFGRQARAADTIKIAAIYPLTGGAASAGVACRDAIEVATDIINNPHPGSIQDCRLAPVSGLPGLGAAARLSRRVR